MVRAEPLLEFGLELRREVAGLDEKGIRAGRRTHGSRSDAVIRGNDEHDRRVVKLLEATCDPGAVEMRHVEIHEDQLWV